MNFDMLVLGKRHIIITYVWLEGATEKALTAQHLLPAVVASGGVIADQIANQIIKEPIYRLADGLALQVRNWLAPPPGAPNPVKSRGQVVA